MEEIDCVVYDSIILLWIELGVNYENYMYNNAENVLGYKEMMIYTLALVGPLTGDPTSSARVCGWVVNV